MNHVLKIFMTKNTLTTLEDHFIDSNSTVHRFFYEKLRELAKTSSVCDDQRSVQVNIVEEGKMVQKEFPYKEINLEAFTIPENSSWRPEIEEGELAIFEMKVGEKTFQHLVNFGRISAIGADKFNKSIPKIGEKLDPRFKELEVPECFEEFINNSLSQPIVTLLQKSAQDIFDKENEEIEAEEAKALNSKDSVQK